MPPYTQLDENRISEIVGPYGIDRITHFQALEGGSENTNYRIDTADRTYVLTLSETKQESTVCELVDLLIHLEANGFQTSRVLPTKVGDYLSSFEGKPVLLKEFLHGEIVENLSSEMLYEIGASMASLHAVPVPETMRNRFSYGMEVLTVADSLAEHPFAAWATNTRERIQREIGEGLRRGLIHGDVFFNNVVVTEESGPVIMDFEEAGHYYLVFDLGMAIVGLCCGAGSIDQSQVGPLVQGYQSINPLNRAEIAKLKYFVAYAAAVTACWRFGQFRLIQPDATKRDRYLEMKRIADEALAIDDSEFEGL